MKKITITPGNIAIVSRKGVFQDLLHEGEYWLSFRDRVEEYLLSHPFTPSTPLNILLKHKVLADALHVVDVADTELVLHYEDGRFLTVLKPGRYAYWKGLIDYRWERYDVSDYAVDNDFPRHLLMEHEVLPYLRVYVVESYEAGLLYVNGKFDRMLEPGIYHFWKNATALAVLKTDMRQQQLEISGQEILTQDKASLRINANLMYKVVDAQKALAENKGYDKLLYSQAQLALREYIGSLTLDELLEQKATVGSFLLEKLQPKAAALGLELCDCGIRDVILPGDVKEIMNRVLIAQKSAQANVITRREETASTRSLLNTAKLMEDNDMLYKLKEMEYVEKIAEKINSISVSGGGQIVDQLKTIFAK